MKSIRGVFFFMNDSCGEINTLSLIHICGWLGTLVSGILMGLWYAGMWKNAPWQVTVTGGLLWGIYLAFWQIVERYALPFLKRLPPDVYKRQAGLRWMELG